MPKRISPGLRSGPFSLVFFPRWNNNLNPYPRYSQKTPGSTGCPPALLLREVHDPGYPPLVEY